MLCVSNDWNMQRQVADICWSGKIVYLVPHFKKQKEPKHLNETVLLLLYCSITHEASKQTIFWITQEGLYIKWIWMRQIRIMRQTTFSPTWKQARRIALCGSQWHTRVHEIIVKYKLCGTWVVHFCNWYHKRILSRIDFACHIWTNMDHIILCLGLICQPILYQSDNDVSTDYMVWYIHCKYLGCYGSAYFLIACWEERNSQSILPSCSSDLCAIDDASWQWTQTFQRIYI